MVDGLVIIPHFIADGPKAPADPGGLIPRFMAAALEIHRDKNRLISTAAVECSAQSALILPATLRASYRFD